MMNKVKLSALLSLSLALGACGTDNRGLESVHQPVVSRSDYAFDVYAGQGGIAPQDEARVRGWFDSLQLGYGDRISVDTGGVYGGEEARRAIGQVAARYGMLLQESAPATTGQIAPGTVRVVVSRLKASVPGCPDHSRPTDRSFGNHTASNYGCATNSNLAAMIADPEDLVRGKTGDARTDSITNSKAIKAYREAEPTGKQGLKVESTGGN